MARDATEPASEFEHQDLLLVGRVVRPHGVRGEIKVAPETEGLERLAEVSTFHIGRAVDLAKPHPVENVRFQETKRGPLALVKLEGVDTREAAEGISRLLVYTAEEELPPLEEDEFFIHDLIGLQVVTEDGRVVGTVQDVMQAPAHDIYVIERESGGEALVPAVDALIADVDLEASRLVIRPIEGLLD